MHPDPVLTMHVLNRTINSNMQAKQAKSGQPEKNHAGLGGQVPPTKPSAAQTTPSGQSSGRTSNSNFTVNASSSTQSEFSSCLCVKPKMPSPLPRWQVLFAFEKVDLVRRIVRVGSQTVSVGGLLKCLQSMLPFLSRSSSAV